MYLNQKDKNKLTIGKQLRKLKGLRKHDEKATLLPENKDLLQYRESLTKQGMVVNNLQVALFQTKNGLKYPGFVAKQKIKANSILLRIPVNCLLTTRDAFVSQIQQVFQQNPLYFSKTFSSDWQDRMLLTFLLFQYQKDKKSKWYLLLKNLPKQIDYVITWNDQQLNQLHDKAIKNSIQKQRQKVFKQMKQLQQIIKKYPKFFKPQIFSIQNMLWIHVHLVTRCFGKYFQYTTMVPYAQLFNHQCIDTYYTMAYNQDNPHNPHQKLNQPKQITQEEQLQADTSDGSYDASDVQLEDQYFQQKYQQTSDQTQTLPKIRQIHSYIVSFIGFNQTISLPYICTILEQLEIIQSWNNQSSQLLTTIHQKNCRYYKMVKQFYNKLQLKTYTYGLRQKIKYLNQTKQPDIIDPKINYFEGAWKKDKFDQFLMVCGANDQYEKGSQVYFCYGRLPNRLLLMRYGIALQHNKYNHVFIRIDISQYVLQHKPLFRLISRQIALKKYKKYKLKRTKFNVELIVFYRVMQWQYKDDLQYIFKMIKVQREEYALKQYSHHVQKLLYLYSISLQQNQKLLHDSSLGYHQYFALVYRVQQQRILIQHLNMIQYALEVLHRLENESLENILKQQKNQNKLRFQIMMESYFHTYKK